MTNDLLRLIVFVVCWFGCLAVILLGLILIEIRKQGDKP